MGSQLTSMVGSVFIISNHFQIEPRMGYITGCPTKFLINNLGGSRNLYSFKTFWNTLYYKAVLLFLCSMDYLKIDNKSKADRPKAREVVKRKKSPSVLKTDRKIET